MEYSETKVDIDPEILDDVSSSSNHDENHIEVSSNNNRSNRDFLLYMVSYVLVVVTSLVMRFTKINFSDDGTPVFDEKHYATQAEQMVHNGGMENNPGYGLVVHPPLGKMLMSIGEHLFGYTPMGWRFMGIIAGLVTILLICGMVQRVSNSPALVLVAGIVANLEGTLLVMSRTSMLDIYQVMFITMIAFCMVFYMTSHYDERNVPWHQRYWLLGAGIASGCAMSVKISGVYYPFVIGVILVFYTLFARRNISTESSLSNEEITTRESMWSKPRMLNLARATGYGLFILFVVPVSIFVFSFANWFRDTTSWGRHAIEQGTSKIDYPQWVISLFPDSILNFIGMHKDILQFHTSLTTSEGNTHPWESKPWQWLFAERPMLFLTNNDGNGNESQMWLLGNIGIWYALIPLFVYGLYKVMRKDIGWIVAIVGFSASYFPWVLTYDRQMYFFYAVSFAPFLVMMFTLAIRDATNWISSKMWRGEIPYFKQQALTLLIGLVSLIPALLFFIRYIPWYYGLYMPKEEQNSYVMFDTWKTLSDSKDNMKWDSIGVLNKLFR